MDPKEPSQNQNGQPSVDPDQNVPNGAPSYPPRQAAPAPGGGVPPLPGQDQDFQGVGAPTTPTSRPIPLTTTPYVSASHSPVPQVPSNNAAASHTSVPQEPNQTPATTAPSAAIQRAAYKSDTLQSHLGNKEPIGMSKKIAIMAGIAAIVVVVLIVGSIITLFSSSEEEGFVRIDSREVTESTVVNQDQEVMVPVIGVEKDSILRSADNGKSFKTHFWVETEEELGQVDVLTISFHPQNRNEITVSTYDDGLFVNQDDDNSWEWIPFPPQKIYSFILDKANPDSRAFASGVVSSNGRIFRTEDKGQTWRAVYAEPGDGTYVSALTQDLQDPDIVLAGTNKGTLVRSTDGGDTWKNIGQDIRNSIDDFVHDSKQNSTVYLLSRGKLYHSYDAGVVWLNWEEIKNQEIKDKTAQARELSRSGDKAGAEWLYDQIDALREKNQTEKLPSSVIHLTADPNVSGVLYAGLSRGLYRSTDYGKYWKPVNIIESAERFPIPSIAVNPEDSDEIAFVAGNSFYRSINYGSTWAVTPLDKTRNASFVAYDPFDPTIIYVGLSAKK